jgi:hypothetical protein
MELQTKRDQSVLGWAFAPANWGSVQTIKKIRARLLKEDYAETEVSQHFGKVLAKLPGNLNPNHLGL